MLLHYLGKADRAKYMYEKKTENLKKHPRHHRSQLEKKLTNFNNFLAEIFLTQLAIK